MPSSYAEARYNLIEAEKKVYKTLIEDYKHQILENKEESFHYFEETPSEIQYVKINYDNLYPSL
jgi:hypothetical protein